MKNTIKKLLSILLVAVMCLPTTPLQGCMGLKFPDIFSTKAVAAYSSASINIGDKIVLGTYEGQPISWVCVDKDDNGPLMLSEKVICQKEYDAAGYNSKYHSDSWGYVREKTGSNCWEDSNIRQWLNTSGKVNYSHCPPSYENELGFMSNFTIAELSVVKKVAHKVTMVKYDSTRNGYCDGGTTDVFSYGESFNIDNCYHKLLEDSFMLLDASQINRLKNINSPFLSCGSSYFTAAISGNNFACFDIIYTYDGGKIAVCNKDGIRPAFYIDIEAYNNLVQSGPVFPAGYDFDNDRYKFENIEETIDIKYYTGMFGEKKGTEIHNYIEDGSTHGHCYGMALTTAATLLYSPAVAYYISWIGFPYTELRNVNPGTLNIDIGMSAKDYIKYGHIYQFSVNSIIEENRNKNKLSALFSAVESYTKDGAPLIIGLLEGDNEAGPSGHAVYAIGIDGDDILVNDSNEPKAIKRIEIDGSTWHYSGGGCTWTNKDSDITYFTDVLTPYMNIKMAVDVVGANVPADESEEICGTGNRFAIGMPTESDGTNLVVDSTDSFRFVQKDSMLTIGQGMASDEATSNNVGSLYWLIDGHTIEAQNVSSKNAIVKVTGDEMSISANIPTDAQTSITIDSEKDNNISILCNPHELSIITFSTVNAKGEFIDTQISGTASGDTITATQTETGLLVTGISDGTVTLSKNEEVIATKTVTDAISDIEITYDKTGADTSVELKYEQAECEHDDTDGDGKCDICGESVETPTQPETPDESADDTACSCICHSENSIVQFFYTIFRFLWQLLGMNMDCTCGAKHFDFYFFA